MRISVRLVALVAVLSLGSTACGTASPAPSVGAVTEACAESSFCLGMPEGWSVADRGERYVTIEHPDGADATVGFVEMDRVVEATGSTWPQAVEQVSRSLWALFDGGEAELDDVTTLDNGSVRTVGSIGTGIQWHLLVPFEGTTAVGVVVRAPARSWRTHVDPIFGGLRLR